MEDTRCFRYRWAKKPGRPEKGADGPSRKMESKLFASADDVPDGEGWGVNFAHAKVLAGVDYDPAVDGEPPEGGAKPKRARKTKAAEAE